METAAIVQQLGNWTQAKGPLHGRLSAAFVQAIGRGAILPGTRLPAERILAEALALSRTTVLAAFHTLKSEGWLESRTGSGTWVNSSRAAEMRHRRHSAAVDATATVNVMQLDSAETIDLASGSTAPLAELPRELFSIDAGMQNALLRERSYMPPGLPQMRAAVAQFYTQQGLPTSSDQILITSGAQQAISLAASLYVQRGDTVLVESPTYFGALDVFRLAGARLAGVPVGPEHVPAAMLRDRIVAAGPRLIYLTPSFQNPTGAIMPESTRQAAAALADEFGIPLIEDHALSDLSFEGTPPGPIAKHSKSSTILTVSSMSKLFWAALRVGWVRGPVPAISQLARLKTGSDLGSALVTQAIAAQLLTAFDAAKEHRRRQLSRRRDLLVSLLRDKLPDWEFSQPSGGLFLWVRLPGGDAGYFAQYAARHGVAITPGNLFSADDSHAGHLRIPFALDEVKLSAGVERLAGAWREFRGLANMRLVRGAPIV